MTRAQRETIHEALTHFDLVMEHASADVDSQLVIDAVCMRLSAGLEVLNRLDAAAKDRLFGDEWPVMWGMRNRIAHGYLLVDSAIVRRTLADDIPAIVRCLRREVRDG